MSPFRSLAIGVLLLTVATSPSATAQYAFFDRDTDTIAVSGNTVLGTTATFEVIFALTGSGGSFYFEQVDGREHKQLAASSNSVMGFAFTLGSNETSFSLSTTVPPNVFHHLAFVRDGTEERLYLNGVLLGSRTVPNADIDDANPAMFPRAVGASAFDTVSVFVPSFVGLLDTIRISSAALYSGNSFTPPTGDLTADATTQLLFNFNPSEVSGNTIMDLSGQGNIGTFGTGFSGATSPTIVPEPSAVFLSLLGVGLLAGLQRIRRTRQF
jgi:hypothetical protein